MQKQDQPFSVQRFDGGFAIVYHDKSGKRRRFRLNSTDRQSAEAEARKKWEQSFAGSWTVGRIMTSYLANREKAGIKSIQRRHDAWKAMKPFWNNIDPDLIDQTMCEQYAATRPVGAWTLRTELGTLATALNWANDNERRYIDRSPKIWRPAKPERVARHLSVGQFRALIAGSRADHARLYMQIGIFTMARPEAILELQWAQVDFETGLIDFNPPGRRQTKKRRPVLPMNNVLRRELLNAHHIRQSLYVIERGAKPIKSIKKAFQAASERSGVKATPYTLRHTGAVWAAERGVPMSELAQYMGHDDSATTEKHYARYSPGYLRGVADAIEIDIAPVAEPEVRKKA